MNDHMNHILQPLSSIMAREEQLRIYISANERMPAKILSFEQLPQAVEDESRFVETIDF